MLKKQEDIQKFKADLDKLEKVMTRNLEIQKLLVIYYPKEWK